MCHPQNNTIMFTFILMLALSTVCVQSQRRVVPAISGRHVCQNINTVIVAEPYIRNPPIVPKRCDDVTIKEAVIKNTVLPATVMPAPVMPAPVMSAPIMSATVVPATAMPVLPFITELPSCPDICFNDILKSPLGCLDPILTVYGTTAMPVTELPVSPLLPAASPVSRQAPPFSKLFPPACDCKSHFLDRLSLPPPFI